MDFNPGDTETDEAATDRQLVIDGKALWFPIHAGKRKIREPLTEALFVRILRLNWQLRTRGEAGAAAAVPEKIDGAFIEDTLHGFLRDMDHRKDIRRKT
jgi:hypothetical protein